MNTKTKSMYAAFALLAFVCVALLPRARAQCRDGCDNNNNTYQGNGALGQNTTGPENTAIGFSALANNITGGHNTAIGDGALSATNADWNTGIGEGALYSNTTGYSNTANGFHALYGNTTGYYNTADGLQALITNTTGYYNVANGGDALYSNTTGHDNTASGEGALYHNIAGYYNTANGSQALVFNTMGNYNAASGAWALSSNTMGNYNAANGAYALASNTTGNVNTADGEGALASNTSGSLNVALGFAAGLSLTTGNGNVCVGAGVFGVPGESNTTWVRNVYASVATARPVYVNSDNKIGTLASTRRVKQNIKPMDKASEAVLALKPVSFRYKKEIDASGTPQFGLVAEEVADINADLVTRDSEGKPETVRYDAVNAMLLNEFLKEHKRVEEEQATIAELKDNAAKQEKISAQQQKQIDALTAVVQKVSAQLEVSKAAPQTALNNQ